MLRKIASFFTYVMKHLLPDAYLFAILLTFISMILSLIFTDAGFVKMITEWGNGIYGIAAFAFQMILILITGHALALTPFFQKILKSVSEKATSTIKAGVIVSFFSAICCWINWGFGLIMGGLLALEIAKKNKNVDFAYLIAAAYSGFIVWHQGLSGSVPLVIATAKHPQNFIEKAFNYTVPVSQSIFSSFNLISAILIIILLPVLFSMIHPDKENVRALSDDTSKDIISETTFVEKPANPTFAERIDHSYLINMIFGACGLLYLIIHFGNKGFDLNLNIVIFIFFIVGVILHGKPVNYIKAVNIAVKGAGGIALQFPLYGGIQGVLIGTGLAKIIAGWFVALSSPQTFYMLQFWAAGVINMFIPSGGGQWAAQGPITIEAAKMMGIDPVKSAMMVAWGDQWTNMIQPFWALPLLGLAKLSARDIMGYTAMTLFLSGIVLTVFSLLIGFGIF